MVNTMSNLQDDPVSPASISHVVSFTYVLITLRIFMFLYDIQVMMLKKKISPGRRDDPSLEVAPRRNRLSPALASDPAGSAQTQHKVMELCAAESGLFFSLTVFTLQPSDVRPCSMFHKCVCSIGPITTEQMRGTRPTEQQV